MPNSLFQDPFLKLQEQTRQFLNREITDILEVDYDLIVSGLRDSLFEGLEYVIPDFYYLNWIPDPYINFLFNNNPEVKFKSQSLRGTFETISKLHTKITNTKDISPQFLEVLNNLLVLNFKFSKSARYSYSNIQQIKEVVLRNLENAEVFKGLRYSIEFIFKDVNSDAKLISYRDNETFTVFNEDVGQDITTFIADRMLNLKVKLIFCKDLEMEME